MKSKFSFGIRPVVGFTLVELLTVIAIVGVLVAIIIPVVGGMRKNAATAKAVSNIRQLVTAHLNYAAQNRGKVPLKYTAGSSPVWQESLAPYLNITVPKDGAGKRRLRQDPDTIFNVPDSKPFNERSAAAASIARNWELRNSNWNYQLNVVPNPSRTILLGECEERNLDEVTGLKSDLVSAGTSGAAPPGFRRANGTEALMGFCDGHVQSLTRAELVTTGTVENRNRWRWWTN